ncbi:MAG: hypothetical protein ACFFE2_06695 [Candidatus Thorarchaeota archaeon]
MKASTSDNGFTDLFPVIVALSCLWLSLVLVSAAILVMNSGYMVYTLDDTYIHLAISKNLNEFSIFGVTKYEFSSSSSSPFWNLILSATFALIGISDIVPLLLNMIIASVAVVILYSVLKDTGMSSRYLTVVLVSFVFFTSLPGLVFTGMEHTLHVLFSIIFIVLSSRILSFDESNNRQFLSLLIVTLLASAVRIETVFLVLPVALLFSMRRKWSYALSILGIAALPWLAYGIASVYNGWLLIPNSLLVKRVDVMNEGFRFFFTRGIGAMVISPHLIALMAASIKLTNSQELGFWHSNNMMRIIFVISCMLHFMLGRVGWFFRYEAYLVALGILTVSIQGQQFISELDLSSIRNLKPGLPSERNRLYGLVLIVLFTAPLVGRGVLCIWLTPTASNNIYEQQYQMGLFLGRFYTGEVVLINDIGCVNYLSDIVCVDKWGIGTLEIGEALLNGSMSADTLRIIAEERGVKVAVLYADDLIPEEWEEVGYWTIPHNVVARSSTVTFFAVLPSERDRLIDNLVLFSSNLAEDVIEGGLYTTLL